MATESTSSTTQDRGSWQTAMDAALEASLRRWADNHLSDLDDALKVFTDQAGVGMAPQADGGWYGTESPFAYALRWRGEDLMKAEASTMVAKYVLGVLDGAEHYPEVDSPSEVYELVDHVLEGSKNSGLRATSSSQMSNTLQQMRGQAALEFSSSFSGLEQTRWEAHYDAMKMFADETTAVREARKAYNEAKSALSRTRSESGTARLQPKVDAAEENLRNVLDELAGAMHFAGAPDEVVASETKFETRF